MIGRPSSLATPPFSAMNSTPAHSSAARMATLFITLCGFLSRGFCMAGAGVLSVARPCVGESPSLFFEQANDVTKRPERGCSDWPFLFDGRRPSRRRRGSRIELASDVAEDRAQTAADGREGDDRRDRDQRRDEAIFDRRGARVHFHSGAGSDEAQVVCK